MTTTSATTRAPTPIRPPPLPLPARAAVKNWAQASPIIGAMIGGPMSATAGSARPVTGGPCRSCYVVLARAEVEVRRGSPRRVIKPVPVRASRRAHKRRCDRTGFLPPDSDLFEPMSLVRYQKLCCSHGSEARTLLTQCGFVLYSVNLPMDHYPYSLPL